MLMQNFWPTVFAESQDFPWLVSASKATANGTSLVINKPAGTLENDLLVAIMNSDASRTWTGDTSWTERTDQSATPSVRVATLVAGASEGSSYTFTMSGPGRDMAGQIFCLRNAVYDAIGSIVARVDAGDLNVTGLTSAGGIIILALGQDASGLTAGTPSGMSIIDSTSLNNAKNAAFIQSVSAGATGTRTSAITGTGNSAGVQIGIKAA